MRPTFAGTITLAVAVSGACATRDWPDAPPIDRAAYESEYTAWRDAQRETAVGAIEILGVWPLSEGDTAFGADPALPIVLSASFVPQRAGVFRQYGGEVSVVPEPGGGLRMEDGPPIERARVIDGVLALGSLQFIVDVVGNGPEVRRFVTVWDDAHPAARQLSGIATFPLDPRWRVAARFDALESPTAIRVPDVRGGSVELTSVGTLVMRLEGAEHRLTAIAKPDSERFFVMFKDATNGSTTFGGYRVLYVPRVRDGQWTVADFNMAGNPPLRLLALYALSSAAEGEPHACRGRSRREALRRGARRRLDGPFDQIQQLDRQRENDG